MDYWAKVNLACTVTVTKMTTDAIEFFEAALAEVEVLLGVTWVHDLTNRGTGETGKLIWSPTFKLGGVLSDAWIERPTRRGWEGPAPIHRRC